MSEWLNRISLLARKWVPAGLERLQNWRSYLADAFRSTINLVRHYTPIFLAFLCSRLQNAWQAIVIFSRRCLELAAIFLRRVVVFISTTSRQIAELVRYYTPIIVGYLRSRMQIAWQATSTFCRQLIQHTVTITRNILLSIFNAFAFNIKLALRIIRLIALAFTTICRSTITLVRHYTPILLNSIRKFMQIVWQTIARCCRLLIHHAERIISAVAQAILGISGLAKNLSGSCCLSS
jgi:hypothetical protein